MLTGKGLTFGGSLARTEATGYGLCYFTAGGAEVHAATTASRARPWSSPAPATLPSTPARRLPQLGGKVVTMSDSNGYVYDPNGIDLAYVKDHQGSPPRPHQGVCRDVHKAAVPTLRTAPRHLDCPLRHRPALRDPERDRQGVRRGSGQERLHRRLRGRQHAQHPGGHRGLSRQTVSCTDPPRLPTPAAWLPPAWR